MHPATPPEVTEQVEAPETGGGQSEELEEMFGRGLRSRGSKHCTIPDCRVSRYPHKPHDYTGKELHRAIANIAFATEGYSAFSAFDAEEFAFAAAEAISGTPTSYDEAMRSKDAPKWRKAADEEVRALFDTGTLERCVLPPGARVIGGRWTFKDKRDQTGEVVRNKARFVAQGFSQEPGRDYLDTYAPVARMATIRS
eukprot:51197-Eustigmatos_ZCMA.PRE.1